MNDCAINFSACRVVTCGGTLETGVLGRCQMLQIMPLGEMHYVDLLNFPVVNIVQFDRTQLLAPNFSH